MAESTELQDLETKIDKLYARVYASCVQEEEIFTRLEQSISNISKFFEGQGFVCNLSESKADEVALELFEEMPARGVPADLNHNIPNMSVIAPTISNMTKRDSWSGNAKMENLYEDVFASGDLPRAAEMVANMWHHPFTVGVVAKFATVSHQLEVLEDRLEDMVQPVDVVQDIRGRIDKFVEHVSDLHIEHDSELEFIQEELNASPIQGENSDSISPGDNGGTDWEYGSFAGSGDGDDWEYGSFADSSDGDDWECSDSGH